jgi:hypothetical protein
VKKSTRVDFFGFGDEPARAAKQRWLAKRAHSASERSERVEAPGVEPWQNINDGGLLHEFSTASVAPGSLQYTAVSHRVAAKWQQL